MSHRLSRRQFSSCMLAGAAGLAIGSPVRALAQGRIERRTLFRWSTPRGLDDVLVADEQGGVAMLVRAGDGAILVDTKNAGFGPTLQREASEELAPVTAVILTHHHADHTGGVATFRDGAPVTAHANLTDRTREQYATFQSAARSAIRNASQYRIETRSEVIDEVEAFYNAFEKLGPDDFTPTRTVEENAVERFGGLEVHLRHFGPGHTDNDLCVHVPSRNLMHVGDLVFNELHPFVDTGAGATTVGWRSACRQLHDMCNAETVVVPGHGSVGGREILQAQIDYFDRVEEFVRLAMDVEIPDDEFAMLEPPAELINHGFEQLWPRTLTTMRDEILTTDGGR